MTTLYLVPAAGGAMALADGAGRVFDAVRRRWGAGGGAAGTPVSADRALAWLQRESGHPFRPPIAVVGPREATDAHRATARAVGELLGGAGFVVLCGGRQGVMEAVCAGVAARGGISVGLLPDEHWDAANAHVTIPIATGIGVARNAVIARAAGCLVAIGGGYGTLSEMAFGLQFGRPVLALLDAPEIVGVVRVAGIAALADALLAVVTGDPPGAAHG